MLRAILSVIAGYFVMAIIVVVCFTALQLGLGTERVFQPGSYQASPLFLAAAVFISIAAAIAAGWVCAAIARTARPPKALAIVVVVLGVFSAVAQMTAPDPGPRTGDISPFEAAGKGQQAAWYSWSLPIIGAAGVLAGARLKGPRIPTKPAA